MRGKTSCSSGRDEVLQFGTPAAAPATHGLHVLADLILFMAAGGSLPVYHNIWKFSSGSYARLSYSNSNNYKLELEDKH